MDHKNAIFRSLDLIESRISEKLTVENIAGGVYFSKYHYSRLFREIVGDSVMEYVTKRKLTLAGRALLETDAAIIDIALDYGYDSREGFTRSFKAYMGVSPTEYRKYGLTAISRKTVKEKFIMTYSKTTDEIIRELNDFVAKARETAEISRKHENSDAANLPFRRMFWDKIADKTDDCADKIKDALARIASIAERPDEINNRFNIIRVIEDTAFITNVMALHVMLTSARNGPEIFKEDAPLCERYRDLAAAASMKSNKIARFLLELSSLIFDDMRKTAAEKLRDAAEKGKALEDVIDGYEYIKREITSLAGGLAAKPIEDISVKYLDDCLFKLRIISFSADTDVLRSGGRHKAMFAGLPAFTESLREARDFFQNLVMPEPAPDVKWQRFEDIAFQLNVLLFYTRGEVSYEKMGRWLIENGKSEVKAAFDRIESRIDASVQAMYNASGESAKDIAEKIIAAAADMDAEADKIGEHGVVLKVLADELKNLGDAVMSCVKE